MSLIGGSCGLCGIHDCASLTTQVVPLLLGDDYLIALLECKPKEGPAEGSRRYVFEKRQVGLTKLCQLKARYLVGLPLCLPLYSACAPENKANIAETTGVLQSFLIQRNPKPGSTSAGNSHHSEKGEIHKNISN